MSKQALEPVPLFSKTGVRTNVFGQVLGTRQESDVPARGYEMLPCPAKLRCLCSFFLEMVVVANLFAQTLDTRRESEVLTMG